MKKNKAVFILKVLSLSADFYKRKACDDKKIFDAAQSISDRYEDLKKTMGFEGAANQAQIEFLVSLNLDD
jgi:hypothetical protein